MTNEINGSIEYYTLVYLASDISCASVNIPASSCAESVCRHTFTLSLSTCQHLLESIQANESNIVVHASGTNIFGRGSLANITFGT